MDRNPSIDLFRGIAIVSVVLIHTTYCSGELYAPQSVRNFSLFFDVGLFFFATGLTLALTKKIDVISQIRKITSYFMLFSVLYTILTFDFDLDNFILPLFLSRPDYSQFEVIGVSYWFIPVYISVLVLCSIIVHSKIKTMIFLIATPIYYSLIYFNFINPFQAIFLGTDIHMMLYYTWLVLAAKELSERNLTPKKKIILFILSLTLSSLYFFLFTFYDKSIISLQAYKFPTQLPYIIITLSVTIILFITTYNRRNLTLEFLGKNAIICYIAQGVSSSILFKIENIINSGWILKFITLFAINVFLCIVISYFLVYYFRLSNRLIEKIKNRALKIFNNT